MTKRTFGAWAAFGAAVILIGCGGSGGGAATTPMDRAALQNLFRLGLKTQKAAGEGLAAGRAARSAPGTREAAVVYFDSFYQVWVKATPITRGTDNDYFEDELMSKPAGGLTGAYQELAGGLSESTWTETVTAGPRKGFSRNGKFSYNSTSGTSSWQETANDPLYGAAENTGSWTGDGRGTYSSRWSKGGEWYRIEGTTAPDGSWTQTITNHFGISMNLVGNANGSGSGVITGPSFLLPAVISFQPSGIGEVVWADGTKTPYSLFDGGTTGGNGSSGGATGGGVTGGTTTGGETTGSTDGGGTTMGGTDGGTVGGTDGGTDGGGTTIGGTDGGTVGGTDSGTDGGGTTIGGTDGGGTTVGGGSSTTDGGADGGGGSSSVGGADGGGTTIGGTDGGTTTSGSSGTSGG